MKRIPRAVWVALSLLVLTVAAGGQEQKSDRPDLPRLFEKKEAMIPMRDGVKLHTEIYTPRDASGPLPFLTEFRQATAATAANSTATGTCTRTSIFLFIRIFADATARAVIFR